MNRANRPRLSRITGSSYASRTMTRSGDGSTLSLDFTTGVLDPRFTFTRNSTATFINASGNVATMAAAPTNDPTKARFTYDPATRTPLGLLFEGSAINIARYSDNLETTGGFWGANLTTRNFDSADVNPTGGTGSMWFVPSSAGSSRFYGLFLSGQVTSTVYTYSVWLKGRGTSRCVISIQSSAGAQNATMSIISQPLGASASVTQTGGGFSVVSNLSTTGWTKVQVVLAANLGGTGTLNVYMYPNDTAGQTTSDSVHAWGAQLETGSGASSYIPTTGSQGTRVEDSCVMNDISSLQYSATNGALFWRGVINKQPTNYITLIGFMTAADQPTYESFGNALNYFSAARGASLATGGANEVSRTYVLNQQIKYASAVDTVTNPIIAANLNGSAASTTKSGTGNLHVATRFVIGRVGSPAYAVALPSCTIAQIKYWPVTKTAAELNLLTTT